LAARRMIFRLGVLVLSSRMLNQDWRAR